MIVVSLVVGLALAAGPDCPACQWNLPSGVTLESAAEGGASDGAGLLKGGGGADIEVMVRAGTDKPLDASAIEGEIARLTTDLASRGYAVQEPTGRILNTALGEPTVMIEFGIAPRDGQVVPAGRGARLVKRCGPTATFDLFADPAEPQRLSKASAYLLWAQPECHRFNRSAYVAAQTAPIPLDAIPEIVAPAPVADVRPVEEGVPWGLVGGFGGLAGLLIGLTLWHNKRSERKLVQIRAVGVEPDPVPTVFTDTMERAEKPVPKWRPKERPATPKPERSERAKVDDAVKEVYEGAPAGGSTSLQGAMAELSRVMPLTRPGSPFQGASGIPERYADVLAVCDGPSWGQGWLRLISARPGTALDVKDLNRRLSRVLGGRFAIGYGGFGIVLAMESSGRVVACEPYFGSLVKIADDPQEMFRILARDAGVRGQICDADRLRRCVNQAGDLLDGQVFDPGAQDAHKTTLLELWATASPLPAG